MAATVSKLPKGWLATLAPEVQREVAAYLQGIEKNAQPSEFDVADASTATTTATITSRTVNDTLNGSAGTDSGAEPIPIGIGPGTASVDSMTRIANMLTALYANDAALLTAIETLSARLNTLVGTVNEIIAAETPD